MFCRTIIKLIRLAILFIWQSVSIVTIAKVPEVASSAIEIIQTNAKINGVPEMFCRVLIQLTRFAI